MKFPSARLSTCLRSTWVFAFLLPALLLLAFVAAYGRSFPIWETWYFIPVWREFHLHGAWLSDLFVNRWGHVSAIPSFINLMLDNLSGYDQRVDLVVSAIFAIAALFLLLKYYVPREAVLTRVFLGLTFLSLRATEIWLDGWDTMMTASLLLSVAAGACVLATRSWMGLLGCALLAFLGLNSSGYCLAILPSVLAILLVQAWQGRRAPIRRVVAQVCAWILCTGLMLWYWRFLTHGQDGGAGAVIRKLLAPGFFDLFGRIHALLLGHGHIGTIAFAATLALFLMSIARLDWQRFRSLRALPALVYMAAYSTVLTVLIETSRTVNGEDPLHLRYIPFLCMLPVALLAFSECLSVPDPNHAPDQAPARQGLAWRRFVAVVLCAFIASAVWNDVEHYLYRSLPNQPQLAALDRAWQRSPWTLTPGMFLYRAAADPALVAQGLEMMREQRMGPFGRVAPAPTIPPLVAENRDTDVHFGIDRAAANPDGNWIVEGWAFNTRRNTTMADVYGQLGDCSETALIGLSRSDVATFFKTPRAMNSGWMLTFPASCAHSPHPLIKIHFIGKGGHWNAGEKQP